VVGKGRESSSEDRAETSKVDDAKKKTKYVSSQQSLDQFWANFKGNATIKGKVIPCL